MNSRVQTLLTVPRRCVLLILTCVAACPWWAMANEPSANPTAMNFEAAGTIRMNLNVGDMQIVGAQGDKITVSWHSSRPEDESRVSVKVQRSGKNDATVVVRIADDGPGLPKTVRDRLFRRQRSGTGGSGLGLSLARELAERNGGVLRLVESARGTTFVLELIGAAAAAETGALRSLGKRVEH